MAVAATRAEQPKPKKIVYPVRDGKPMAETDKHADLMVYGKEALRIRYAGDPMVYVSGNNFLYYVEGDPKQRVSPDVYVVFGVPKHQRDFYKVWEEGGRLPSIVFEFTSKKTRLEDVYKKRPLYERLGIREYVQFDPTGDYLRPRLQGFRLENGVYVPLPLVNNRLYSEVLGLELVWEGERLRFYDPIAQEWLLTPLEMAQAQQEESQRSYLLGRRLETEVQRAEEARRLAEEERQQTEEAKKRTEQERQRADEAEQRAEQERQRAEQAEAENARLRAELEALRRQAEGA